MNVRRCLRQLVSPTGRHRAPRPTEDTVPVAELLRPAEVNDLAHCPACKRDTMHAFQGDTRTCFDCRRESPTAVPRG